MPLRSPGDQVAIRSTASVAGCSAQARPWVLAATILGSSMAFIDGTVVNVALPVLQNSLHATVVDVQWVIESYGLLLSALLLTGGALGDSLGRRRVFLWGTALFAVASVGCGLSNSVTQLLIARSVQGIGAAALVPGSLALISSCFDEKSRGAAIGTWSGATAITTALGPVLGGWLIAHASWHWVFLINAPLAAAVILISLVHVPESRNPEVRRSDWIGSVLATVGLGGVVFGFLESPNLGWGSPLVAVSVAGGFMVLAGFIFHERMTTDPMMPLELFRSRNFSGANLLTFLLYSALGVFFFIFPLNLIQVQHYSTTATGAAGLPMILLMFLLSRWAGGLVARIGPKIPLLVGPCIVAAGFVLLAIPSVHATYFSGFFPGFVILGLGMSVSVAPLTTVVMASVDNERAGAASGINNTVSRAAGVFAIAVLGPLLVYSFGHALDSALSQAHLAPDAIATVRAHVVDLGALQPPSSFDEGSKEAVRNAVEQSFVYAFRRVMLGCAALALLSAAASAWTIRSEKRSRH